MKVKRKQRSLARKLAITFLPGQRHRAITHFFPEYHRDPFYCHVSVIQQKYSRQCVGKMKYGKIFVFSFINFYRQGKPKRLGTTVTDQLPVFTALSDKDFFLQN